MVLVFVLDGLSHHLGLDSDTCAEINPSRTPTNSNFNTLTSDTSNNWT